MPLPDFESLTSDDITALDGPQRAAYYAWRKGDSEQLADLVDTYPNLADEDDSPPEVETPEGHGSTVETPEAKPSKGPVRKAAHPHKPGR